MAVKVAIVDAGAGNIHSIHKALGAIGADPILASSPRHLLAADKLILPGVGHFESAMARLHACDLVAALTEAVLEKQRPVLGICLGMQLMGRASEEGRSPGLGWIDARAVRFGVEDRVRHKVPHIGWNGIEIKAAGTLLRGVDASAEFYFSHSYHLDAGDEGVIATTSYAYPFASVVEKGHIFGTQFHPEKSKFFGLALLRNFIAA